MMKIAGINSVLPLTLILASPFAGVGQVLQPGELCSDHSPAAIATFEDANLEAAIRAALSVGDKDDLTCGLVLGLTEFGARQSGIANLVGIQNLTGLTFLNLSSNAFTDISALSGLTGLTGLWLGGNLISDLGPLSGLMGLTALGLNENSITDLDPLSGLTGLTELWLGENPTSDLGPLSGLTGLTELGLNRNSATDFSPLSGLTGLTVLELWDSSISDISAFSGLTGLTELRLSDNSITDIGPLSGLTSMRILTLDNNSISDVSALSGLPSLTSLTLDNNNSINIQPLLGNAGLGAGDDVFLRNTNAACADVALLQAKEVTVVSNCKGATSYRVLFLGNSVFEASGGILQPFEGFCTAAGLNCEAISQNGNAPSIQHGIEWLGFGRTPTRLLDMARTEWIHSVIESGEFDYVILDQRRPGWLLPDWIESLTEAQGRPQDPYEETLAALTEIHRSIVESGAQTAILAKHAPSHQQNLTQPMTQIVKRLGADLERVEVNGEPHPVLVVPAGSYWVDASNQFGGVDAWYADPGHGNQLAQYASACLIFTYLTGRDPRQNPFRDLGRPWNSPEGSPTEQVSEEAATWIKNQAWLYYTTWR